MYLLEKNNTTKLLCLFSSGESTVIWKEADRIISAGDILIRKDRRLSIVDGFSLKIDNLRERDAGERRSKTPLGMLSIITTNTNNNPLFSLTI